MSFRLLLDTDVLSAVMRRHPLAVDRARGYLAEYGRFSLSVITQYEILRGLKAKGAEKQQAVFSLFCDRNELLPVTDDAAAKAADIYADLSARGALISDADILIAATALVHGLGVVTNNEDHFSWVRGLRLENWLRITR